MDKSICDKCGFEIGTNHYNFYNVGGKIWQLCKPINTSGLVCRNCKRDIGKNDQTYWYGGDLLKFCNNCVTSWLVGFLFLKFKSVEEWEIK